MIKTLCLCVASAALGLAGTAWGQSQEKPMWVYIGTSGQQAKGIYSAKFDASTGKLSTPELAAETKGASYVWVHPSNKYLLATGQVEVDGKQQGALRSFSIDHATGKLTDLGAESTGGGGPCYVSTDDDGKFALAANYGTGSVAVIPVGPDGKLAQRSAFMQHEGTGPNAKRQTGPHGHCFDFDPAGKHVLACDLGIDQVKVYRFDNGKLEPADPIKVAPGAGPRQTEFSKDGKRLYVLNEMGCTLTAFNYDDGKATDIGTVSMLPGDYQQSDKDTGSELWLHPSGKFLYASNRGHDSIVRFKVDPATGKLSDPKWTPSGGKIPRYFGIDPTGKWMLVANQGTGNILSFRVSESDGALTPTGDVVEVPAPTCIKWLPAE